MKWLKSGIVILFILSVARAAPMPAPFADEDPLQLPKTSLPIRYDLTISTSVETGELDFSGDEIIEIEITQETDTITLHNHGLTIESLRLLNDAGEPLNILQSEVSEGDFLLIKSVDRVLNEGELLKVEVKFGGLLQLGTSGFYRSSYRSENVMKHLAVTQFQESEARKAFVCYDEPGFKAEFKLTIIHSSSLVAISNTEGSTTTEGDTATTTFATTPKMSSYLLAFVVADFKSITNEDEIFPGDVIHTSYAQAKDVEDTLFGMSMSALFLQQLQAYTNFKYELKHMFSASIPDFGSLAMENWGLTLFKEQLFIVRENVHPREMYDSMRIIANTIGHQFFGNAVTCKTWDHLWLNEGFAAFFEYSLVDLGWMGITRTNDLLNVQKLQTGFLLDKETAHPMNWYGEGYIYGMYYDKAVSVIRMFQHAVGEEIFTEGLNLYLTTNEHKSVTSDDLYEAFDIVLEKHDFRAFTFANAFKSWEVQIGFPLIHVSTNNEAQEFIITQERYFAASDTKVENDERSWFVPLNFATAADPSFEDTSATDFLPNGTPSTTVPYPSQFNPQQWFIFNKQQHGYYRVNYDENNWREIIKVLKSPKFEDIHVLNRAQLIDDSMNFAADGYLSYEIALEVVSYLERETDFIPWKAAVNNLEKLDYILKDRPVYGWFKTFVRKLARHAYLKYSWEETDPESLMDRQAREIVIDWTCRMGDERCLAHAYAKVRMMTVDGDEEVPAAMEIPYICHGLKGLNKIDEFRSIFKRFQESDDQAERLRLIDGLTCATDPISLNEFLASTLVNSIVSNYRIHERTKILSSIYTRSSVGFEVLIDFIKDSYDEFVAVYSPSAVDSVVVGISRRTVLYEDQVKLTEFMDFLGDKLSESTRTRALKNIDDNKVSIEGFGFFDLQNYLYNYNQQFVDIEGQLRIPRTSLPDRYRIHIDARNVHTSSNTAFSGEVHIETTIKVQTNHVVIHSKRQTIQDLKVTNKNDGSEVPVFDFSLYPEADTLTIYFSSELPVDSQIVISIKYSAFLLTSANGFGFYQTSYLINGETRYMAATNFESSVSTRYAFPHYDEPGFKAIFELKITHDVSVHAISNTLGAAKPIDDDTITTTFEATPRMASYLLAFIVSDLESIDNADTKLDGETLHKIWVRSDSLSKAKFALENSVNALKALEDFVGVKFELPICNSAGVPLKTGAMENWGMVTYRENAMIYEENYDDIPHAQKYSGVSVISHELAHQFFGDLVTMEWWDYIWLNEGFATLFEYQITGTMYPEWRIRNFFNTRTVHSTFRSDALETTRSMTTELVRVADITRAFDNIAYGKAGSVLRMFQNAVGFDIFKEALNLYLETNKYQSVNSQHLLNAINTTMMAHGNNQFNLEQTFRSWELQKGFPLIHVSLENVGDSNIFYIEQQRYLTNKPEVKDRNSLWHIPLNFAYESNPDFDDTTITSFMPNSANYMQMAPPQMKKDDWFIFNKQQLGYYRVNYDFENWHALMLVLNSDDFNKIHILNRAQLIDDSLSFAAGGYLDFEVAFGILGYLSRETEYSVWYAADRFIAPLFTAFGIQNYVLNVYIDQLSEKMYEQYRNPRGTAIPVEGLYERFNREIAIKIACNARSSRCLDDMFVQTQLFAVEDRAVPKGLESLVYCNGLRGTGKQSVWLALWQKMQTTTDSTLRSQLISALGCSDDVLVLKDYLESTLTTNGDATYTEAERRAVLSAILNNDVGLEVVIFFIENYELDILRMFGFTSLETMISVPARTVKNGQQFSIFSKFLQTLTHLDVESAVRVSNIVQGNFLVQQQPSNVKIMKLMRKILGVDNVIENTLRLSTTSTPQSYKLHIDARNIQTGDRAYSGEIQIDVLIKQSTNFITFHSKNQRITELKVMSKSDLTEVPAIFSLFPEADTITVYFANTLDANSEILVNIKYSTTLNDPTAEGYGFYQSSYTSETGETKYFASTQFEPARARFAFPHYDEPSFKAVFELKITHDYSRHAISNTFGHPEDNYDGTFTTTFEPTPIMSSYLIAFIVSDFESLTNAETKLADETLHRIWVRPGATTKAEFALNNSVNALKALEEYVGFKYEMPKVDSAGEPNSSGAMENWGMIIYRENAMVYEDDIAHDIKWSGVGVIAHELAHQFFGNAVTLEWWDYIWLNEGFATLFDYMIPGILYPHWRMRDFFNVMTLQYYGFQRDARDSTKAMTTATLTLDEISDAFSAVAYDKAGAVLRMFQNAVGEDIFRAALNLYVTENEHKSVTSQHLIDAMETKMKERGLDSFNYERAFRTWETQKGFPVIHVSLVESRRFRVTQQRYFTTKKDDTEKLSWYIPLNVAIESNPRFEDTTFTNYFVDQAADYTFDAPAQFDASQWFIFNKQQLGYYRVNYDAENWHALMLALNSDNYDQIHVLNRAQIVDDVLNFAVGGYSNYEDAFEIISYLDRETEFAPWSAAELFFDRFYRDVGAWNEDLNAFLKHLSAKFYNLYRLPASNIIPQEGVYERYSRELAMKIACDAGNEQCLTDTNSLIRRYIDANQAIPRGLEHVIFCNSLRGTGKQGEWTEMWKKMQNSSDSDFRLELIRALGCSEDSVVLKDYLESTLGDTNSVRYSNSERRALVRSVLESRVGLSAVINFVSNFERQILNFGYDDLEEVLTSPARSITTRQEQSIFTNFLLSLDTLDAEGFRRLIGLSEVNLKVSEEPTNVHILDLIHKMIINIPGPDEDTTTIMPVTTVSPVTTVIPVTTVVPPTDGPTPPTNPTNPPVDSTTTTTTLGASSLGIKCITLIATLLAAYFLK